MGIFQAGEEKLIVDWLARVTPVHLCVTRLPALVVHAQGKKESWRMRGFQLFEEFWLSIHTHFQELSGSS